MSMHDYMPGIWCDNCKALSPPDEPCKCNCCIECGLPLRENETYACSDCASLLLEDEPIEMVRREDG